MKLPPPKVAKNYSRTSSVITSCLRSKAWAKQLRKSEIWRSKIILLELNSCQTVWCVLWWNMAEKGIFVKKWLCNCNIYSHRKSAWCWGPQSQARKQCELYGHLDKCRIPDHKWRADHIECKANFKGSAPAMEPEGVDLILRQSVELYNLRYTDWLWLMKVNDAYQASSITIKKKSTEGFVSWNMKTQAWGKRQVNRWNKWQAPKLLWNYHSFQVGNLAGMKNTIHANVKHCASSESRLLQDHYRYQQNKANNGPILPLPVISKLKSKYVRLSDHSLLTDGKPRTKMRHWIVWCGKAPLISLRR